MRSSSIALVVTLLFSVPALSADTLNIIFTGDILLARGVRRVIEHHGVNRLFSDGIDSRFRSDANWSLAIWSVLPQRLSHPSSSVTSSEVSPNGSTPMRQNGITHLNLANNHAIDQGREGLMDTRQNILRAGMTPIGAGANMQEASEPMLLATEPRPVWFCHPYVSHLRIMLICQTCLA